MNRPLSYVFLSGFFTIALASASVCPVPVSGLDRSPQQRIEATSIFDEADGELRSVHLSEGGETASPWRELTAVTLRSRMDEQPAPQGLGNGLGSYGQSADSITALSGQQHGIVKDDAEEPARRRCLLCEPGAPAPASAVFASMEVAPFDPAAYAAALPQADESDPDAPATASASRQLPGEVRVAALVLPPAIPKRNALFFFCCGGFLILAVRIRRMARKSH